MSYHRSLGEDPVAPSAPAVTLELLAKQNTEILRLQKDEANDRKWTLLLGAAGVLFAAVKLGIVAFPAIHSRRHRQLGQLGDGT